MKFTKMHGLGNDYVYVNCLREIVEDPVSLSKFVSDRHFGIGSDGLILIKPSDIADFEMDMYNADGSRGKMCGNGIRCVGKYVYDYGLTQKTEITVATGSGVKELELTVEDGSVKMVKVNMGCPILEPENIPAKVVPNKVVYCAGEKVCDRKCDEAFDDSENAAVSVPLTVDGKEYNVTLVSMGNPHAIVVTDDVKGLDIEKIGPLFENHEAFPDRINTEFIHVIDRNNIEMRVWERGSAETMACGTGACAVTAACILNGYTDRKVTVHLLGGDLEIEWNAVDKKIYMNGPATIVFDGEIMV